MDGQSGSNQTGQDGGGSRPVGRLTLRRGGHVWRFECGLGDGPEFGRRLNELTARADCPLGPADAAFIGLRLAGTLAEDFGKLIGGAPR